MKPTKLWMLAAILLATVFANCRGREVTNVTTDYAGVYLDDDHTDNNLVIASDSMGGYHVRIGIFRLASFDDGHGQPAEGGLAFTATDPAGQPIGGTITLDGDTATVTVTDSHWEYLPNGEQFHYVRSSASNRSAEPQKKEVSIALAWWNDAENEFLTNMVTAFQEAGISVTVLPQVKADYLDYNGDKVTTANLDAEGIGYLSEASGAMIRAKGYAGANAAEVLKGIDGVVFCGGEDIASTLYAVPQDWHHVEAEIDFNPARDVSDYLTMTYCLDHDIPVMGFCRGAQMLGVVSGATMIQDIPTWFAAQGLTYNYEHRRNKAEGERLRVGDGTSGMTYRAYTPHDVTLTSGSTVARFFGTTTLTGCPSWHHQAILSTEGTSLRIVGTTTVSGIDMVEAVERTDMRCAIGVQFHPEAAITKHVGRAVNSTNASQFMPYDTAIPLFRAFINECKK